MLDPQDEFYDRRLATHLVSLYHQTQEEEEEEYLVSKLNWQFTILFLNSYVLAALKLRYTVG